ncbi:MAG: hypothetical protein RR728_02595, partial [Oscillospiraceae bacterium]
GLGGLGGFAAWRLGGFVALAALAAWRLGGLAALTVLASFSYLSLPIIKIYSLSKSKVCFGRSFFICLMYFL